ncbi:phage major tail tube protein [Acinetobacter bereziniae]|uniref:phage major tail tube protein n=1 Tax=Acinetobacter bereziniae TaxID=106648 RepID=UPI00190274CD|nr:phage major tail tube protein [Acinetobacter bereziniae]MBJ8554072.1 phage major tail tube protein [Acinetobacter bereziniae]MCU4540218.1 phage major tail tube protein [Acinetobacter bereziniae]MCU4624256.1 phage major tail tube protein [Acinetobacter bereziniae]
MTGVAADIRKNWNIFIDGKGYAGKADEYNPPELEEENEDYRAAGMDAAIDIRTGMKKLTSDFTLNSHSRDTLALFGVKQGKSTTVIVREAMESFDGTVTAIEHTMQGKVVKISQGKVKAGELPKDKYDMSLTYYKQTIAGKVIHEIDVINMVRIIDGVDVLADIRNAIGI